jgi:hypothetical protein
MTRSSGLIGGRFALIATVVADVGMVALVGGAAADAVWTYAAETGFVVMVVSSTARKEI